MIEGNKCLSLEGGFKMNEEKRKKENREVLITSIIGFIISNIYVILAAIFWDTSRVADALIILNGIFIFVPAFLAPVCGWIVWVWDADLSENKDKENKDNHRIYNL